MASRNPLGKIKDLTRGAASAGLHVAGQATRTATSLTSGVVGKLAAGRRPAGPGDSAPTEPVNVTEELGLDPAPVEPRQEPLTTIDAAADPAHVEATPADVARKVAKKAPARKAAKKAPAAKRTPAKKTAPGAKLPPRKKAEPTGATADQTE